MQTWLGVLVSVLLACFAVPAAADDACDTLLQQTTPVPLGAFLRAALRTGDVHTLVDHLERAHGGTSFRIATGAWFGRRTIFVLQDRTLVQSVMRKQTSLPYVNRNFDASHGHYRSINSVNTRDALWRDLHDELSYLFSQRDITPLLDKYKHLLVGASRFNLNQTLEEYYLRVWSEYCFGPVEYADFRATRDRLVGVLGRTFHQNKVNRWPVLGRATSVLNRWRHGPELRRVDADLARIVQSAIDHRSGVFFELHQRLAPKYADAFQITLDNAFLAILVYDFIHIVMLDTLAHVARDPALDPAEQFKDSRHHAFLYPFRFRVLEESYDGFRRGDFAIVNLQKANLYFSAGDRFCPGAGLFGVIARRTLAILSDYRLSAVDPNQPVVRSPNRDLPFLLSEHDVTLERCPFKPGENTP